MNAEIFAEWLKRQGHHIIKTESSYWYNAGPRSYQAFPYHWLIKPSETELKDMLLENFLFSVRYSTYLESPVGKISYHAVYDDSSYDFETLGKWAKKNVRRGLKKSIVEPITFDLLSDKGFLLQIDTLRRQKRKLSYEFVKWRTMCLSAKDLPGFEAWGALVNGNLGSSVITFQMNNCCYMLYQQCHSDYLKEHVNNALSFEVTKTMTNRNNINSILYGLHSLDAPASVDEFKFRMGYKAKPVRQRVVFHPFISPLANSFTHKTLKLLCSHYKGNPLMDKAEGMLRFYLEGKLPLKEQNFPEPLSDMKESIFAE